MNRIYLDYNATTPPSLEVRRSVQKFIETADFEGSWGNPSSIHWASRAPKLWIRETHQGLAQILGCQPLELIFTSGGSESNSTVIRSFCERVLHEKSARNEFITSLVEHPSVLKTFRHFEALGLKVHYLGVNRQGKIDLDAYRKTLSDKTALVSVMMANNETGNIFPIQGMTKLAHEAGAYFHSDMVQAFGKIQVCLRDLGVDYASFSAHKFYALKGTGVLYVKKTSPLEPLIIGGGQERHRRGGTENTLGILALGASLNSLSRLSEERSRIEKLRDEMERRILNEISDVQVTGGESDRLPNTSSLILKAVDGETLLMSLDLKGVAVSTGAACSSGNPEPSPVLLSMGLTRSEAQTSLRVSLGWATNAQEIAQFIDLLKEIVERLRKIGDEELTERKGHQT